jgi:hypothetical protein
VRPRSKRAAFCCLYATFISPRWASLTLEDAHSRSPWRALATLVSCVGASLTSASRADETSHIQDFAAALFRARRPECTADDALARALRNIASDVRLPKELRPDTLTPDALAEAAIDGLNYQSSDLFSCAFSS